MSQNKNTYRKIFPFFLLGAFILTAVSCSDNSQSPGYEYMPDMYRSPAIEAYVDYPQDRVSDEDPTNRTNYSSARQPVEGTISHSENGNELDVYNHLPYPYENTNEGYEQAGAELKSPLEKAIYEAEGKEIYEKMCLHCHGEKGAGDGKVVTNGGHARPNAYDGALKSLTEGKMFHTLTYGKGMMGSHASQLDKVERWKVIQYVQMLQNGGKSLLAETTSVSDTTSTENDTE